MKSDVSVERGGEVEIPCDSAILEGELTIPEGAKLAVLFAHGSGSSRHSPRNQHVARVLRDHGLATLLFDLLTREEESVDLRTGHLRFDIALLADRLVAATMWFKSQTETHDLKIGYFGSSTGGGAALVAAADLGDQVSAVVSRGGRPDLAEAALPKVKAATLLIVGENDRPVIRMNEDAYGLLTCEKELKIVSGATHLFEEPGKLDEVARLAGEWFVRHAV